MTHLRTLPFGAAVALAASLLTIATHAADAPKPAARPNVVFILADDQGIRTLGCYGNRFIDTPNIDRMAAQGLRFSNAYTAAPVCSPTRAALITGQWPVRCGINDYLRPGDPQHLDPARPSLPRMFQQAGYRTAIIGKWHLSGYAADGATEVGPDQLGFDEVIVSEKTGIAGGSYFHPYHFNRSIERRLPQPEYLTDRQNLEAIEFIRRNKDHPFFLYLSHYAPHTKLAGKPDLLRKYQEKAKTFPGKPVEKNPALAAMIECIDAGVGDIRKTLDELGLANNTLVIFTSDNGGESNVCSNAPYRGGKSMLYDGGIRVPMVATWPGVIPPGKETDLPVVTVDFMATFASIVGGSVAKEYILDGIDLSPLLRDPACMKQRPPIFWHYPIAKPHFLGGVAAGAVRDGDWKLIEFFQRNEFELYNLADDPGETRNLAQTNPAKRDELLKLMQVWRSATRAPLPHKAP